LSERRTLRPVEVQRFADGADAPGSELEDVVRDFEEFRTLFEPWL
jgi:hypothetical protein